MFFVASVEGETVGWLHVEGAQFDRMSHNDSAIAFLEDHGWTVESTREGHCLIDGELVDEVQLAVWLDRG